MVMYDVTDNASFRNLRTWLQEIDRYACENVSRMIVGTKADEQIKRVVSTETAKEFAESLGIDFIETSAKTNVNVTEAFLKLTESIARRVTGENLSLNVKAVNFDAKKKEIVKEESDSDDESFEEEELESNLNDLAKKEERREERKERTQRSR